jgi:hypothetical protein
MLTTEVSKAEIVESFQDAIKGTEGRVIILDDKVIKLYSCPRKCFMTHEQQELAAKFGLGPDVYSRPEAIKIQGREYFYYVSEKVEVVEPELDGYNQVYAVDWDEERNYAKAMGDLITSLRRIGIHELTIADLTILNIGWKNGSMVCIDFGRADES